MNSSLINKVKYNYLTYEIQIAIYFTLKWTKLFQITIKTVSKTQEFIKTLPQNIVPKDYGGLAPDMSKTNGE